MVTKVKAPTYVAQHKAAAKPASKLKATVIVEDVTPIVKPTLSESIHDDIKGLFAKYKVAVPSATRYFISCVAAFCVSFGIGYIGGLIVETLVLATLTFTGLATLGLVMYILGVLATVYVAYKAGCYAGNLIMSGDIDHSYQKYSNKVRSFFSFGNREVTA